MSYVSYLRLVTVYADRCENFDKLDLEAMDCQQFDMNAGDVLYLPRGIVHFATTESNTTSAHLTVSMDAADRSWKDFVVAACVLTGDTQCEDIEKLIEIAIDNNVVHWNELASRPTGSTDFIETTCMFLQNLLVGGGAKEKGASLKSLKQIAEMEMEMQMEKDLRRWYGRQYLVPLLQKLASCSYLVDVENDHNISQIADLFQLSSFTKVTLNFCEPGFSFSSGSAQCSVSSTMHQSSKILHLSRVYTEGL